MSRYKTTAIGLSVLFGINSCLFEKGEKKIDIQEPGLSIEYRRASSPYYMDFLEIRVEKNGYTYIMRSEDQRFEESEADSIVNEFLSTGEFPKLYSP